MEPITVKEANAMSRAEFVERFGELYEHSPWVAEGAAKVRPFESVAEMREAFEQTVRGTSKEKKLELIRAHPDLAGKAAVAGELTEESA
ncbi:MAG: 2-oxo-4-hydroxy-4-carboxy-5-ureidoimidazoline decarboxylase, partial [Rubrobacteraceae bacterium]